MAKVAHALGTPLMPWQRHVADVAGELDPDGRLHYREVRLTIPRQSGKTTLVLAEMIDRCFNRENQRVSYTAQTRSDARKKWEDDWQPAIIRTPFKHSVRWRKTNGHEATIWTTGSIQDLMATTRRSGHGPVRDMGIIDEAFAQEDDRLEQALAPSMITRPEPQLWIVSTAGDERSLYLKAKVDGGRELVESGAPSRIAYFEWSADPDADPLDPATWWSCMPALGRTTTIEAIETQAQKLEADGKPDEFLRAYLNLWVRQGKVDALPGWVECESPGSKRHGDDLVFAIDAAPELAWSSIVVCARNADGRHHLEVIEHDIGAGWLPARLAELVHRRGPRAVMFAPSSPIGSLLPVLKAAGIEQRSKSVPAGALVSLSPSESAKAALFLADSVKDRRVAHLGQPALSSAVVGAVRRAHGDGGFLWNRVSSSVDISPLVAVTEALWGFETVEPPPSPGRTRVISLADL